MSFKFSHAIGGVHDLTLKVRHFHRIEIDKREFPNACAGQIQRDWRTQTTHADHQYMGVVQLLLPLLADLRQR